MLPAQMSRHLRRPDSVKLPIALGSVPGHARRGVAIRVAGCKQMIAVFGKAGLFVTIHIVVIGGMLLLIG
jgi:hypothetical protein